MAIHLKFNSIFPGTNDPCAFLSYDSLALEHDKYSSLDRIDRRRTIYRDISQLVVMHNLKTEDSKILRVEMAYPSELKRYFIQSLVGSSRFRWEIVKTFLVASAILLSFVFLLKIATSLKTLLVCAPLPILCFGFGGAALLRQIVRLIDIVIETSAYIYNVEQSKGLIVVSETKELDSSIFSRLKNKKEGEALVEPFTGELISKKMLAYPRIIVADDQAYDAVSLLKHRLFLPLSQDSEMDHDWTKVDPQDVESSPILKELERIFLIKMDSFKKFFCRQGSTEDLPGYKDLAPIIEVESKRRLPQKLTQSPSADSDVKREEIRRQAQFIGIFALRLKVILEELPSDVRQNLLGTPLNDLQSAILQKVLQ